MEQRKGGGKKLRRSQRKAGSYAAQFMRTARNKASRARRVKRRADYWTSVGGQSGTTGL